MSEGVRLALRDCLPQRTSLLSALPPSSNVTFAYKPVWALGTDKPASADHVLAVVGELRRAVQDTGKNR